MAFNGLVEFSGLAKLGAVAAVGAAAKLDVFTELGAFTELGEVAGIAVVVRIELGELTGVSRGRRGGTATSVAAVTSICHWPRSRCQRLPATSRARSTAASGPSSWRTNCRASCSVAAR